MTALTAFAAIAAGVVLFLVMATVLELHRQVEQIRKIVGLQPDAVPVAFDEAASLAAIISVPSDHDGAHVVLILSDTCATCADIARALPTPLPERLTVAVQSSVPLGAGAWIAEHGLPTGPNVIDDTKGAIALALGIKLTPVAIRFEADRPTSAVTVPSTAQLSAIVDWATEMGEPHLSRGLSPTP